MMRKLDISEIKEMNLVYDKGIKTELNKIRTSRDSARVIREIIGDDMNVRESVIIIAVSRDLNRVNGYYILSKGGIAASVFDPLLLLKLAVVSNSASFIIGHNHPSGNIQPSDADLSITKNIIKVSKGIVDILDHLIVTENSYFSMRDEGKINGFAPMNFDYLTLPKRKISVIEDLNNKTSNTMINIRNIKTEYPKINQSILPKALKQDEFEFVSENLDLYTDDEDIKKYIDTFILKLNEVSAKNTKISKPKKPTKKATTKPKAKTSTKKKKTAKRELNTKSVGNVDLQVTIIKSFVLMQGKEKTATQILNLYKRIEKSATELKIRKTSKYAKQIMYVSEFLKDSYNDSKFNIQIPTKKFNELYDIAYSEKQKDSVRLIKRYVGMYGLEDNVRTEKRAENLLKAVKSALSKKKITKSDMYFEKIKTIENNLEAYLLKNKNLHPSGLDLRGLAGIVGIAVPKKKA